MVRSQNAARRSCPFFLPSVYSSWPYAAIAVALGLSLHAAGVHAALAGVILAAFLPTRPAPAAGPLLAQAATALPALGAVGIGHTRWATHGTPSERNAHPHRAGPVVVLHNGIIEDHAELRASRPREAGSSPTPS